METENASRPNYRRMSDPELLEERARVREQLEHRPDAEASLAELAALAELLDAEITARRSVLIVSGGLAPAAWR